MSVTDRWVCGNGPGCPGRAAATTTRTELANRAIALRIGRPLSCTKERILWQKCFQNLAVRSIDQKVRSNGVSAKAKSKCCTRLSKLLRNAVTVGETTAAPRS